jgi:hypothetical protein
MSFRFGSFPAWVLFFIPVACGSPPPVGAAGDASAPDAASPQPDGQAADVRPFDDASIDAPTGEDHAVLGDTSVASDTGVSADTGPGDGATGSCVPSAGTMTISTECDLVQLAILRNGGAAEVRVSGRVGVGNLSMPPCAIADSVDVVSSGMTVATIPGLPGSGAMSADSTPLAAGPANAALTKLCASDSGRFDGVGLVVHGHMDGGTFTAMCGNNTPDMRWPPSVVITCHTGLTRAPLVSDAQVTSAMGIGMAYDEIFSAIPQPPVVTSVDPTVHIIPGTLFAGTPLSPSDTMGWMTSESTMMEPDGSTVTDLSLVNVTDVLGSQLCPPGCTMPPCPMVPPVFLARVTGATDSGPFESELYVPMCPQVNQ